MKIFIYAVITIVFLAVVAGFFIMGSPKEERLRKFDERRVQDLQFLQGEIINYWINKEKLPEDLSQLKDDIRGISIPKEPETGQTYKYEMKGVLEFSLCANFNRPSLSKRTKNIPKPVPIYPESYYGAENWQHQAGYYCFERKIDKDFYKPRKITD